MVSVGFRSRFRRQVGRGGVGGGGTPRGSSPVLAPIRERDRITPRPETHPAAKVTSKFMLLEVYATCLAHTL